LRRRKCNVNVKWVVRIAVNGKQPNRFQ
jgi:hypothetical protein